MDRAVAEHLLHVEGDEEEHREQRCAHQKPDDVRARQRAQPEDAERHQWRLRAQLDGDERADQRRGDADQTERLQRSPTRVGCVDDRVDEDREAGGDGHRAGGVEVTRRRLGATLGDQPRRQRGDDQRHRHVDPQHPLPAEAIGEYPAEEHSRGAAGPCDGPPGPERLVALGAVTERRRDDRECRGRDDRGTEALGGAGGDQLTLVGGEAGRERRGRDDEEAGDEHSSPSQQVGQPPAEQQEAAEGEHVGVDDPGQALLREVEALADRRQRHVDDRGVEYDDELREAEQGEGDPAAAFELLGCGHHRGPPRVCDVCLCDNRNLNSGFASRTIRNLYSVCVLVITQPPRPRREGHDAHEDRRAAGPRPAPAALRRPA